MGRPVKRPDLTPSILGYLLGEGHKQNWISKEFGISQATVSRRVRNLRLTQMPSSEPTPTVEDKGFETTSTTQAS